MQGRIRLSEGLLVLAHHAVVGFESGALFRCRAAQRLGREKMAGSSKPRALHRVIELRAYCAESSNEAERKRPPELCKSSWHLAAFLQAKALGWLLCRQR